TDPGPALHGDELDREIARHVSPPPTPGSAVR
ncbi:MAG: hypothetical protein QOG60_951, partial [Frankiaceae bacterium]|nr:hypothetical protein [Frankiaceae bacterium]